MTSNPFPEVKSSEELGDVWDANYVECVGCIDLIPLTIGMDPVEWAKSHAKVRPWHARFRTLTITNFSVPGTEPATTQLATCGATKTFPDDEATRQLDPKWVGITVTCDDAPHACAPEKVVHSGPVNVNDRFHGVHYWGPGWRPAELS
ncbi:hypothetical protein OG806_09730 [Streptomyces sp. NBC_00882]|uniref:hypothetical protein n=1 Tax=Streptomyces TaxID=1883 RepID=UPI003867C9D2|nr:hypothetical protein OG806_09730 [Streptomyces sp. NBC_00882]WSZ61412.1 hypothetical protein OH824_35080 [Streptomyces canus]